MTILGLVARLLRTRTALLVAVVAGLVIGFVRLASSRDSPDCPESAAPVIAALERFQRLHGRYPSSLDVLVSEKLLPAIPRLPRTLGVTREGYGYEVDPLGDFYTLFYSEQNWFGGAGPAVVKGYAYHSTFKEWSTEWIPPGVQALELAGRKFLADRSSKSLTSFVSILGRRFKRVRWENVSAVLSAGQPCVVEGRAGVTVKADDAEGVEYCFLPRERELAGETVREVLAVCQLGSSGSGSTWHSVFRSE